MLSWYGLRVVVAFPGMVPAGCIWCRVCCSRCRGYAAGPAVDRVLLTVLGPFGSWDPVGPSGRRDLFRGPAVGPCLGLLSSSLKGCRASGVLLSAASLAAFLRAVSASWNTSRVGILEGCRRRSFWLSRRPAAAVFMPGGLLSVYRPFRPSWAVLVPLTRSRKAAGLLSVSLLSLYHTAAGKQQKKPAAGRAWCPS